MVVAPTETTTICFPNGGKLVIVVNETPQLIAGAESFELHAVTTKRGRNCTTLTLSLVRVVT